MVRWVWLLAGVTDGGIAVVVGAIGGVRVAQAKQIPTILLLINVVIKEHLTDQHTQTRHTHTGRQR